MKWFNQMSLGNKLRILFMGLILLSVIATAYFSLSQTAKTMNTIITNSSKEINKQIILNYEKYVDDIRAHATYIESQTKLVNYATIDELESIFKQYASSNIDITSISLVSQDGSAIITSLTNYYPNPDIQTLDWFVGATENEGTYYFTPPHMENISLYGTRNVISISKLVEYSMFGEKRKGVLVIDVTDEDIQTIAKQTNLGETGHMIIISDEGDLVFSTISSCYSDECDSLKWVKETIIGDGYVTLNDNDYYANINTVQGTRWRIATFVDINLLQDTRLRMYISVGSFLLGTLLLSTLLISLLTRQVTSPLNKLMEHMKSIDTKHHLHNKINVKGQKEIVVLSEAFNEMIEEIRELVERLVAEQKAKRRSEFLALQTQINPHFIYNTLDSIVWLSEQGKNAEVQKMVVALSRFFRISISRGKNVIPIEKELEHAKNYLTIQQIRYFGKFSYTFDVDERTFDNTIVKLILQPLIENAINHGISYDEEGHITIRCHLEQSHIKLEVENDGYGLSEKQIKHITHIMTEPSEQSFGLRNVYQRLKLYYGEQADIIVSGKMDEYTRFTIIIPKQEVYQ